MGGSNRGDKLITFQGDVDYNKNPYCVFPLYYSYVTGISSWDYPVFNSMLEIYLKEGFDVSPREGFTGGITDKERANLLLSRNSVVDLFARWDTELTASLINQTGSFIISALKNRVGMGDFDYFFYYYLEDHAFSKISFEQFSRGILTISFITTWRIMPFRKSALNSSPGIFTMNSVWKSHLTWR